ncbi:MAG: L,D-transpeptidase [Streptosporangiales bacterium]|nr:L,D-transpeptidase [Streptosporangiales bacterium]
MNRRSAIAVLAVLVATAVVLSVVLILRGGPTGNPGATGTGTGAVGGPGTGGTAGPSRSAPTPTGDPYAPPAKTVLATTHGAIPKFRFPGGPQTGKVPGSWHHAPSVLPVIAQRPGWLHIRLAQRPNESTAWVLAQDATLSSTPYAIVLDLASTHLGLYRDAHKVFTAPVGVGLRRYPTPVGSFFLAFFAAPPTPAYGAFVMVTSAHSNVISDWEMSGDAMTAIHGPLGSDARIGDTGARVSHGCVRMHQKDLRRLREVPVGTPVIVRSS